MGKFIGYTIGLECVKSVKPEAARDRIAMMKVEYSALDDGRIALQAVSGRNLEPIPATRVVISREAFDSRPASVYDNVKEAIWALELVGYTPAALASKESREGML